MPVAAVQEASIMRLKGRLGMWVNTIRQLLRCTSRLLSADQLMAQACE